MAPSRSALRYDRFLAAVGDAWHPSLACPWWPGALRDPELAKDPDRRSGDVLVLHLERDRYVHWFVLSEASLGSIRSAAFLAADFVSRANEDRARDAWPPLVD